MGRVLLRILKVLAAALLLPPVLLLATCTYTYYSPHIWLDPINASLMGAEDTGWRTVDVQLIPAHLQAGQDFATTLARLQAAGYWLDIDFSTDVGPRDPHPNDGMSQQALDTMFAEDRKTFNARGITHIFERDGRIQPGCGETLFIEAGFAEAGLTRATGYSRWTCL